MVDFSAPTPHLQLINFRHPQIIFLLCEKVVGVEELKVDTLPANVEKFSPGRREQWQRIIIVFGVLLCAVNVIYVFRK
ncbi:hypothetical protein BZM27_42845 [Paraburkholderia steynii]|uniref:Uncharacterized protein n=1 Tax=Paraburkholderia steynii TaxID=1245441 RepID=A0A4R0X6R2_9BURK|nr:hypothetical protein BZM27_42845 [Paraburkholderia steynii]